MTTDGVDAAQVIGDYVGRRSVTYLSDMSVPSTVLTGVEASYRLDTSWTQWVRTARISANVTNIGNVKGVSTPAVTDASGGYQGFPIAPTMGFVTVQATF